MTNKYRILLVEDNPGDARLIQEYLKKESLFNSEVVVVDTLNQAQNIINRKQFDLVLLDLGLPDSNGLETASIMISRVPSIPIVVLTGLSDFDRALDAINGGAQDYLVKDLINPDLLNRSIRYSIHRKNTQAELEKSEEKYRSLWENSPNGLALQELVLDVDGKLIDGKFVEINECFAKVSKMERENIVGQQFSDVQSQLFKNGFDLLPSLLKVVESGEPMTFEVEKNYEHGWLSIIVFKSSANTFVLSLQDITEQKQAEDEISRSKEQFRSVFEESTIPNNLYDAVGTLIEVNQACLDLFGIEKKEDLLGFKLLDDPNLPEDVKQRALSGETVRFLSEFDFDKVKRNNLYKTSKSGIMYLDSVVAPFGYNAQGDVLGYYVQVQDVTEQKKSQQEIKNAADTALLYLDIMSHDLRNQLQAIMMAAEILDHTKISHEDTLSVDIISESVLKSQKLISKVVSTRELLTTPLSEFSLTNALKSCTTLVKDTNKDVEIIADIPSRDFRIKADVFLKQAILNIIENAIEFNNRIPIKLWISIVELDQAYRLIIQDNGDGISDAKKESLFDPTRRFGGVGIHQTIQILQKYGGQISVHDRIKDDFQKGSEFRLLFPKILE
jgi:PAS domain S-box-containing protein